MMMHGITPGPNLMRENSGMVYTVYWGLLLATIAMFLLGRYTTSLFARILVCPNYILIPVIVILLLIGAYVGRYFQIDVWTAVIAGVIAFFMKKLDFSLTAFTLAYVLANLIESRFRRSLMLSQGSFSIFFKHPFCIVLWVLLIYMIFISIRSHRKALAKEKASIKDANN
jgi:putative tricarboxylic transport membrane protein